MNAIREIVKPIDHKLIIELPRDFDNDKEFEVIILPTSENKKLITREEFYGRFHGIIEMSDDFNEPLEDFKEYME